MELIRIILLPLFLVLAPISAGQAEAPQTQELPNPYKLDLRELTNDEMREAVAYVSQERVTIVAYAGTDAPWRVVKDAGEKLAAQGIPIALAWASDDDDNIQTANVIIFAKGTGRDGFEHSTKVGYLRYNVMIEAGAVENLATSTAGVHRSFFKSD